METIKEEKMSIAAEFEKLFEKIRVLESDRRQLVYLLRRNHF